MVLLAIINSKLIAFYHKNFFLEEYKDRFQKILIKDCKDFPIRPLENEKQQLFTDSVNIMLAKNFQLQELSHKFQRTIQRKFNLEELPGKLQNWYLLTYAEFIKELAKKKVKLSLKEEADWEVYFLEEAKQALALKSEIDKTDKEIDGMVYELYGLTEEEIKIMEGK